VQQRIEPIIPQYLSKRRVPFTTIAEDIDRDGDESGKRIGGLVKRPPARSTGISPSFPRIAAS
jgi:hypothetical protein